MTAPVEVVHRCPDGDAALTPCCQRSPYELPRTDRITVQEDLVTCTGHAATHTATGSPGPGPHALAAAKTAAHDAKTILGGATGQVLHDWLMDWADIGWRYDMRGRGLAVTADIQKRAKAHRLGRKYP